MKKIDLHIHSYYSDDGEFAPVELLKMGKKAGLSYMAIADHNSVKGSRIALKHQKEIGISCIPAIEIDATHKGIGYHILGYGIDVNDSIFDDIEENVVKQEIAASKHRCQLIKELGIMFSDEKIKELCPNGIVTGEAIAEAAIKYDVEKNNPLLQPYYLGGNRSDNPYVNFYWDFCSQGKPAYVEIHYPTVREIVELLHKQNALVIVAHPGMNVQEKEDRLHDLIEMNVDGFEVFSSYHTPEQTQFYYDVAIQHNLYLTCGSDFHGKTKPSVHMGMCEMENFAKQKLMEKLERMLKY